MDEDKIIVDIEVEGTAEVNEASKALGNLSKSADKATDSAKKNADQSKKNKEAFTEFSASIEGVIPGFGKFTAAINGARSASLAFIATPIGLILAAIAVALAAVSSWFTSTEEGGDLLAKRFAQLSAIGQVLFDRFVAIGGALVKLFTGDLIGAANDFEAAITGVGDELEREIEIAGRLADMLDTLEDRERSYGVSASVTTNEIKKLILESRNKLLSEREKIDLLQEAFDKEVKQNETLKRIRQDQLAATIIAIQTTTEGAKVQQKYGETFLQYAERLVNSEKIQGAERDKVAKALIAYNQVEGDSLNLREKLSNQIDAQADKERARLDRIKAETAALLEKAKAQDLADSKALYQSEKRNILIDELEAKQAEKDKLKAASKKINAANDEIEEQQREDRRVAANQAASDKVIAIQEAENARIKAARMQAAAVTLGVLNSIYTQSGALRQKDYENQIKAAGNNEAEVLKIKKQAFEDNKKNQIALAYITTAQASLNAYNSLIGTPYIGPFIAPIAAAAALFFGLKNVGDIKKQQFVAAEGGQVPGKWSTIGGRSHSSGGTNFIGEDGTRFQAESDEGIFILKRGAHQDFIREQSRRNQKYGGRSWTNGGTQYAEQGGAISIPGSSAGINIQDVVDVVIAAVSNMPPVEVSVKEITSAQNDVRVKENLSTL